MGWRGLRAIRLPPALSVITCAHGRLPLFARHLDALLAEDGIAEAEYCIAIWGDSAAHVALLEPHRERFGAVRVAKVEVGDLFWPLPRAYNAALAMARSPRILIIGSDILIPPAFLAWAAGRAEPDVAWVAACVREDGTPEVTADCKAAYPYCMTLPRGPLLEVGGWDEVFGDGIVFDDVDLTSRLCRAGVDFRWRLDAVAIHQTHAKAGQHLGDRSVRKLSNLYSLQQRLGDLSIGQMWPLWVLEGRRRKTYPTDDGIELQAALRERLRACYPARAVRTAL